MKKIIVLFFFIILAISAQSITLKQAYKEASGNENYDKFVQLETGVTYTGGLYVGRTFNRFLNEYLGDEGEDIFIQGNGAILDLQGAELCISYTDKRLDIENLIVINGNIRYRGVNNTDIVAMPTGSVRYCTFYKPQDFGIRLYGCGENILLERNIVVDAIDTGDDFMYITGNSMEWLPTGINYAISGQIGTFGLASLVDNWSYFSQTEANENLVDHISFFCEYG